MSLRVTPQTQVNQLSRQIGQHSARIATLRQQISSGVRVSRPSDDPLAMKVILSRQALLGQYETQQRTLGVARDRLNQSNAELLNVGQLLVTATDVASQARTAMGDYEKNAFANQIDSLLTELTDSANAQFDGEYLFSGDSVRTQPYPPGSPQAAYAGSMASQSVSTTGRSPMEVLYTGEEVFHPQDRSATVYIGQTGAAAGAGTDTSVGLGDLTVKHTLTSFAAGSGIAAGVSSAAGDTVLGPAGANVLTINDTSGTGASGTVSLNGGAPVAFTSSDDDLAVIGPRGEVIHLNTTSITAGFNGDVAVASDGTLSRDGGATEVPIDFSSSQAVKDADGRVTYVDSRAIRATGVDHLEYQGTADAFQALIALRDDLRNTRNLSPTEWQDSLTRRMDDLNRIHDHVLNVVGGQAQTLKTIDDIDSRLGDLALEAKQRIGDLAATDIPASATELQEASNLLQYSFAVTAQIFGTSLLDYMA
jgi:flagellar hook-associated protein 3